MKKIALKMGLFIIPVFLVFLFPLLVLYFSGELLGIYDNEEKELFGLSYSYPIKFYKTSKTKEKKPELLILGSSRAMQFEEKFFNKRYTFYNAGGAVNVLENFNLFYKRIQNKPNKIIVTLDPWWFNERYDNLKKNYYPVDFDKPGNPIKVFINQWKTVYDDLIEGKISLAKVAQESNKTGLLAIMKNEGFKPDGSYQYTPEKIKKSIEERMQSYLNDATKNEDRFINCEKINTKALDKFEDFIIKIKEEIGDTNVFIIYPPMAQKVLNELEEEHHVNYYYLNDSLKRRMKNINMDLQYFCSERIQNNGMIDGIHPSTETLIHDLEDFAVYNKSLNQILR